MATPHGTRVNGGGAASRPRTIKGVKPDSDNILGRHQSRQPSKLAASDFRRVPHGRVRSVLLERRAAGAFRPRLLMAYLPLPQQSLKTLPEPHEHLSIGFCISLPPQSQSWI